MNNFKVLHSQKIVVPGELAREISIDMKKL